MKGGDGRAEMAPYRGTGEMDLHKPIPLKSTPAMRKGENPAHAWQCSWCGAVLYIPHHHTMGPRPGSCQGCESSPYGPPPPSKRPAQWWRAPVPVSALGRPGTP